MNSKISSRSQGSGFIVIVFTMIAVLATCRQTWAQEPAPQSQIVIHPQNPPTPALRYHLLPWAAEQTPGNAATTYLLAIYELPSSRQGDLLDQLLDQPIDRLDKPKARALVDQYAKSLKLAETAAYLERCEWDFPIKSEGINYSLRHLNPLREIAMVLRVRAKLQISDGDFDAAIATIKVGMAMAQHLRNQCTLVQALVSTNISRDFLDLVGQMQQIKGAPNLYWALANLPHPMIDPVAVSQFEQSLIESYFPELRGKIISQLNADELRMVIQHMKQLSAQLNPGPPEEIALIFAANVVNSYGPARQHLVDLGHAAAEVEKMPVDSVLAIYLFDQYQEASDEICKWSGVPYWQARALVDPAVDRVNQQKGHQSNPLFMSNPLFILLPSQNRAMERFALLDAQVARTQCFAALCAFAAAHNGQLPATLDEVTQTPIPINPMTGKPFGYEGHGKSATLHGENFFPRSQPSDETIQITLE